jgi:flagellar biosynthesis/type III secretory pathway chaperone
MTRDNVRELLTQLRDIIQAEREYAKELNIQAMQQAMAQKQTLIEALGPVTELHPEDEALAREIQQENRRNAFLFRSTLNWIQDTMQFFGRKTVPTTYGQAGNAVNSTINGRLLSGRI